MMTVSAARLLSRPYIKLLRALRDEGPMRFNQIERAVGLDPKQVDRVLRTFVKEVYVTARPLPPEGKRRPMEYRIAPRGRALLHVHEAAAEAALRHKRLLGPELTREFQATA